MDLVFVVLDPLRNIFVFVLCKVNAYWVYAVTLAGSIVEAEPSWILLTNFCSGVIRNKTTSKICSHVRKRILPCF